MEFKSEEEHMAAFQMLRKEMHKQEKEDLEKRERENPHPTEEELRMGTFIEGIEPQVRDAILTFVRKGYSPYGSGFSVENPSLQTIYGPLELTDDETKAIENAGAIISNEFGPDEIEIRLKTNSPTQKSIENQWNQIADALPDRGRIGEPTGGRSFLKKYAPERTDILRTVLERHIAERKRELAKRKDRGLGYQKTQELLTQLETELKELDKKT